MANLRTPYELKNCKLENRSPLAQYLHCRKRKKGFWATASHVIAQDPVWLDSNEHYIIRRQRVQQLMVVNVYLIQNFNSVMTSQEEQSEYLPQVVESHRHRFPVFKKSIIVKNFCSDW